MSRTTAKLTLPALLGAIGAWMAFRHSAIGDFGSDAAPALVALAHGHLGSYLSASPIMGPVATAFEAPFYMIGGSESGSYHWVCLGCLLALGALAWYLAEAAHRRGAGLLPRHLLAFLCLFNPIAFEAIQYGHPEELLTAALAVGAVGLALDGRDLLAAVCLGLAIATKQWAIIAIFPVLMALPRRRIRAAFLAGGVLLAAYLPSLLYAPGSFVEVQGHAASGGHLAGIWSAWYPLSPATPRALPGLGTTTMVHEQPALTQPFTHFLVVGLILGIPLALWAYRREFALPGVGPLVLLALLAIVRCALDPVDNLYYHAPLLLALLAWDAYDPGRLPLRGVLGVAIAYLFRNWSQNPGDLVVFNLAYLGTIALIGVALASRLRDRSLVEKVRGRPLRLPRFS